MNKRSFMRLLACACEGKGDSGITGINIVALESESDAPLERVEIFGDSTVSDIDNEFNHVGWQRDDGKYILNLRVHGDCWLDGYELARLMQAAGSVCYGGEYDDEHFLYIAKGGDKFPVTSERDIAFCGDVYKLSADIIFAEDHGASPITAGLAFQYIDGTVTHLKSSSGAAGDNTLYGLSRMGARIVGLVNMNLSSELSYPVSYEGTVMALSGVECEEGYVGYTSTLVLDEPLRGLYDTQNDTMICDSLEALSGELVRRVFEIKAKPENLRQAYYENRECFYIPIPKTPMGTACLSNKFSEAWDVEGLEEPYTFYVSPLLDKIYISLGDEVDLESARQIVADENISFLMALLSPIHDSINTRLENKQPAGRIYVEVCTNAYSEIRVQCKK